MEFVKYMYRSKNGGQEVEFIGIGRLEICIDKTQNELHLEYMNENHIKETISRLDDLEYIKMGEETIVVPCNSYSFSELEFKSYEYQGDDDDSYVVVFSDFVIFADDTGMKIIPNTGEYKFNVHELLFLKATDDFVSLPDISHRANSQCLHGIKHLFEAGLLADIDGFGSLDDDEIHVELQDVIERLNDLDNACMTNKETRELAQKLEDTANHEFEFFQAPGMQRDFPRLDDLQISYANIEHFHHTIYILRSIKEDLLDVKGDVNTDEEELQEILQEIEDLKKLLIAQIENI